MSDPVDFQELLFALPPNFTFPIHRLITNYTGANNAFKLALWKIDPEIESPEWMAAFFVDWSVQISLPFKDLLPASKTAQCHGSIATVQHVTLPATNISMGWKQAIRTFVRCLLTDNRTESSHDSSALLPILKRTLTSLLLFIYYFLQM